MCIRDRVSHSRYERSWRSSSSHLRTLVDVKAVDNGMLKELFAAPFIQIERDDGFTSSHETAMIKWNQELRALPRFLCGHQRFEVIRRSPDRRMDTDEWRALPRLLCDTKNWELMQQTRRENKKENINVVYINKWCKKTLTHCRQVRGDKCIPQYVW